MVKYLVLGINQVLKLEVPINFENEVELQISNLILPGFVVTLNLPLVG